MVLVIPSYDLGIILNILFMLAILGAFVFAIYFNVCSQIGLFLVVKNPKASFKDIFKESRQYFWRYLWLNLLMIICIFIGLALLILPGIAVAIFLILINYALFFEKLAYFDAMKRSFDLVKNHWWEVFGQILFLLVCVFIAAFVVKIPSGFLSPSSMSGRVYSMAMNYFMLILTPIFIIYINLIYKNLVSRNK